MRDFRYAAPTSLADATSILLGGGEVRILAGGTDLLPRMRDGSVVADTVLDVKRVPGMLDIVRVDGGLRLGAAVPFHRIRDDPRIVRAYPALTDAARIVGGWQIQARASAGGNLCNASPAADTTPALIVERASCRIVGPEGERLVPAAGFCTAPGRTVLESGELLTSLELPAPEERAGSRYVRFIPRNEMDIAVAGAAAWVRLDEDGKTVADARVALAAVAPTAVEAPDAAVSLIGGPATEAAFAAAGEIAREAARPITDMRGPADYRRHLAGVLVKRALAGAADRAAGGSREPILFGNRDR